MRRLTTACLIITASLGARAAIVGEDCIPRSPELKLAAACYQGAMQVGPTRLRYLGVETDEHGNRRCQNTLLLTSTNARPPQSMIHAVTDNGGNVRVHNYTVPPGKPGAGSIVLDDLPSSCMDRPRPDEPCWTANTLKIDYTGTPGSQIEITGSVSVFKEKVKPIKETNSNQSTPELSRALVDDIDKRIGPALTAVQAEVTAAVIKDREAVKNHVKQVAECWEAARAYRMARSIRLAPDDEAHRAKILSLTQSSGATPGPAGGTGAGASR